MSTAEGMSAKEANKSGVLGRKHVRHWLGRMRAWWWKLTDNGGAEERDRLGLRADLRLQEALSELAATWKAEGPILRQAARVLLVLALTLLLAYELALGALHDRTAERVALPVAGDLASIDGKLRILRPSPDGIRVDGGPGDVRHSVPHDAVWPTTALLAGPGNVALTMDVGGGVIATSIGDRTLPHDWVARIAAHWRNVIWTPWLRPVGDWLLDSSAPYLPLFTVPQAARPRQLGTFSDCPECPEMVRMSDGWAFTPNWLEHSNRVRLAHWNMSLRSFSASPISYLEWDACVAGKGCQPVMRNADEAAIDPVRADRGQKGAYAKWLSAKTRRQYIISRFNCASRKYADHLKFCEPISPTSGPTPEIAPQMITQGGARTAFRVDTANLGDPGETAAEADIRARQVEQADPALTSRDTAPVGAARLHIQFADESARQTVEEFRQRAAGLVLGDRKIDVPAIELVPKAPNRTQLRCFYRADCSEARQLAPLLKPLTSKNIIISEEIGRYPELRTRPRHFELWFDKSLGSGGGSSTY